MKLQQPEYLILQSVDTDTNRYRIYKIVITFSELENEYFVNCFWGRLGGRGSSNNFLIKEEKELMRLVQSLLMKRKRHQYGILEKSDNFPKCKALEGMPLVTPIDKQLKLF